MFKDTPPPLSSTSYSLRRSYLCSLYNQLHKIQPVKLQFCPSTRWLLPPLLYIYLSPHYTHPILLPLLPNHIIMGICSSYESTSVATAKLISHDGRLQEFSYPVKVSYVLQKNPSTFICNSDEMEFDDVVSAISDDDELQLGQLYFALPLSRLRHPLQPEEMAALAVKASSALGGCRRKNVSFTTSGEKCHTKSSGRVADAGVLETGNRRGGVRRGGGGGGSGRRRNFSAMLSAIPE